MRGKRGTKIVLRIVRDGQDDPKNISITRGSVKIKSVKYTDLSDGYGYFRVTSFIENTASELEKAIDAHIAKQKKVEGLLIDLRRNPGGLLDQAVKMSDLFLKDGVIVSTIGRDKASKEVTNATKKARFPEVPLVVLVDEYSASASEIVAGALRDNKRALIVGERTFGKGSVQSVVRLGDGSGLKLTVARYYTPNGISIQAEGIQPDIVIDEVDPEAFAKAVVKTGGSREKDIAGHLRGDREKDEPENAPASENTDERGITAWWKDIGSKSEGQLSAKDKLFKNDYQAYQAFSYLKTWKTLRSFSR
jgi:carboxyl-terminal processing protease